MSSEQPDEYTFTVSAPTATIPATDTYEPGDAELRPDGKVSEAFMRLVGLGQDVTVKDKDVRGFLQKQLVPIGSAIAEEAGRVEGGLHVDEISLTLGIGAEGGLSFVAKASAQAAITVVLRRK